MTTATNGTVIADEAELDDGVRIDYENGKIIESHQISAFETGNIGGELENSRYFKRLTCFNNNLCPEWDNFYSMHQLIVTPP